MLGLELRSPHFHEGVKLGVQEGGQYHGRALPVLLACLVVVRPVANDPAIQRFTAMTNGRVKGVRRVTGVSASGNCMPC